MNAELEKFYDTIAKLESGEVRVAEKRDGQWVVNSWVKEVILRASSPSSTRTRFRCASSPPRTGCA